MGALGGRPRDGRLGRLEGAVPRFFNAALLGWRKLNEQRVRRSRPAEAASFGNSFGKREEGMRQIHVVAIRVILIGSVLLSAVGGSPAARPARAAWKPPSYTLFETGPVRPLALSPNRQTLFACNMPDNRLEVFDVTGKRLMHRGSIPVGMEPVAVAVRSEKEVWVVNHLSDSVSIVELESGSQGPIGRVVRTLLVGDEPRDIVFAGPGGNRAFITTAHRGQNVPYDPQLTTPGVGRADVWVFDADHLGDTLGGAPLTIIQLFSDTPRALAASPDGTRVYAAAFLSGNRTTTIIESSVSANGGTPPPHENHAGVPQPPTGLVVKFNGEHWVDERGTVFWDDFVKSSLPDKDVFVIDAMAHPPRQLPGPDGFFTGVGTVLFNMAINPKTGRVYVSNTDAQNHVRFEGAGASLPAGQHTVQGHIAENRITVLGGTPRVHPIHLNKHIDFSTCCGSTSSEENALSVSMPLGMEVTKDGSTLYVACFGTSEVAVYDTRELENNTFTPDLANQIAVSGGGPSGLALDERRDRLYVLTRFDNAISIIDTASKTEVAHVAMYNPEPPSVLNGRRLLYDASHTSSHGDTSCASCHIFGDFDGLAWDLGDPDNDEIVNNGVFTLPSEPFGVTRNFRPMKGPMTTQSLRGLANHGAMHWRGDRLNNTTPTSEQPDTGAFDEQEAFRRFNVAFVSLNGRDSQIPAEEMQAFTDFILQVTYPPNPLRHLDDALTPDQDAGRDFFFNSNPSDTFFSCNGCHILDRGGNVGLTDKPGFFGTDGRFSFESEPQIFKVPHLRNLYQKVGKFGMADAPDVILPGALTGESNDFMGDQVRGFGFLHDGGIDTINRFHSALVFVQRPEPTPDQPLPNPFGFPIGPDGNKLRRQVEQFMLAFDSNLTPIVGQQVTLTAHNYGVVAARLDLMMHQADTIDAPTGLPNCELVAKGGGRGYLYVGHGTFRSDRASEPFLTAVDLQALARRPKNEITLTCVPPGSGVRMGIDRDENGILDGDE